MFVPMGRRLTIALILSLISISLITLQSAIFSAISVWQPIASIVTTLMHVRAFLGFQCQGRMEVDAEPFRGAVSVANLQDSFRILLYPTSIDQREELKGRTHMGTVISKDGTPIAFDKSGKGAPV